MLVAMSVRTAAGPRVCRGGRPVWPLDRKESLMSDDELRRDLDRERARNSAAWTKSEETALAANGSGRYRFPRLS